MDQRAKSVSNEKASEGDDDSTEILENMEESEDEDNIEDDANFEVEDDFDDNVSQAAIVWEHYKPRLLTNGAQAAYLCSPNPTIIVHSKVHKDPLNNFAV